MTPEEVIAVITRILLGELPDEEQRGIKGAVAAVKKALASLKGVGKDVLAKVYMTAWSALISSMPAPPELTDEPTPKDQVERTAAEQAASARAAYLVNGTARLAAAYATEDQAVIAAALEREIKLIEAHKAASAGRAKAAKRLAKMVAKREPDDNGEVLLGWYAHISDATCARCLLADGRNFNALNPPLIGWPGSVHPHDHCLPGPPHDTDERVEDVDPEARVACHDVVAALTELRTDRPLWRSLDHLKTRSTAMTETRTATVIEVRAAGENVAPGFTARAVQYGVADTYRTSWHPGVFADSMAKRMPSVVWGHDWNDPIGRVTGYRDVTGDDGTQWLEIDVDLDDLDSVPRAKQAYAQLRSGTMDQFSFAFRRIEETEDPEHRGVTRILKADIDEFSVVLNGSVPGTHTTSVRTAAGMVSADDAVALVQRMAKGELDLTSALVELRGKAGGSESGGNRQQTHELRALTGVDGKVDPAAVLSEVDAAMVSMAASLDLEDVEAARRYFQSAASRLSELQWLLGMTPGVADEYMWRAIGETETRAVEEPDEDIELAMRGLHSLAAGRTYSPRFRQ